MADYDIKGRDLRQAFAGFARLPMTDKAIWSLSLAQSTLPDNHVGFQAWITMVAGTDVYHDQIGGWADGLGEAVATLKPLLGQRRRALVPSYRREWGRAASADAVQLALHGRGTVPMLDDRAEQFGINRQPYQRVRDLVAGALLLQMAQYEDALGWAVRVQRHA